MEANPSSSPQPTFTNPSLEVEAAQHDTPTFTADRPLSADSLANNIQGTTFAAKARAAELQAARSRRELKSRADLEIPPTHETITFKSKSSKGKTWKPLNLNDLPERPTEALEGSVLQNAQIDGAEGFQGDLMPNNNRHFMPLEAAEVASSSENQTYTTEDLARLDTALTGLSLTSKKPRDSFGGYNTAQWAQWGPGCFRPETLTLSKESDQRLTPEQLIRDNRTEPLNPTPQFPTTPGHILTGGATYELRDELAELENRLLVESPRRPLVDNHSNSMAYTTPIKPRLARQYPAVKGTTTARSSFPPPGLPPPMTQSTIGTKTSHKSTAGTDKDMLLQRLHAVAQSAASQDHETSSRTDEERSKMVGSELGLNDRQYPWNREFSMSAGSPFTKNSDDMEQDWDRPNSWGELMAPGGPESAASANRKRVGSKPNIEIDKWWHQDKRVSQSWKGFLKEFATEARNELKARTASDQAALRRANFSDASNEPVPKTPASISENDESNGQMARELLLPVLGNLKSYSTHRDYFNMTYGEAPQWCIDHSPSGNQSFFGGDWGTPPPRVGRDPRYRPTTLHDERSGTYGAMVPRWNMWG